MKKSPYNEGQQTFLDQIYKGSIDPDIKITLLTKALGCSGTPCICGTTKDDSGTLVDATIDIVQTIRVLEHELLVQEGLFKPNIL